MDETAEVTFPLAAAQLMPQSFFQASPELVAPQLLGKILAHSVGSTLLAGRIVEVEAYLGPHNSPPDPAAHSFRGPTERNRVLFGPPGHAYVYTIYGRSFCMNVSCEPEGRAGCILLRALAPLLGREEMARNRGLAATSRARELTSGPGRLCQALGISRAGQNALDLTDPGSPLRILDDGYQPTKMVTTPRIGIKKAVDWPLRFAVAGEDCVSGPRALR